MAGPIATSAFDQLCQYASSPSTGPLLRRTRRFFPSGDLDHRRSTHCAYPRRDGQAEYAWVALVKYQDVIPANGHPSQY